MRLQSIHRKVLVIITILAFLWIFQKASEALDFSQEGLDDVNMKPNIEKRHDLEDEIFVKGASSNVQAHEDESIDIPEETRSESANEDNIDQKEKEKLVKNRVEVIAHDLDELRVDIENKIDGPSSNISNGGLDVASLNKNSKLNSKTLKVVEPDVDQNQEAGRKRFDGPAKSKMDAGGPSNPKRGPKHRADKKLQIMKPDVNHDMEAGRKKKAEQNHDIYQN